MNNQDKTKEELLIELQQLQQEIDLLKASNEKRAAELVIANTELMFEDEEKAKRAAELIIANLELEFENKEKAKRTADLIIANIELAFQNEEKAKRTTELIMVHKEINELVIELKQAEVENKRIQKLLEDSQRLGKIGGWEFDVETMIQTWTDEIFHILEIDTTHGAPDVPEGIGFIAPEYQPMATLAIQRAIEFGEPYNQDWEVITIKGNCRWINTIATPYQENGKTKTVSGSFQDITERKHAEIALVESERKLSTTLHSIGDGVISTDKNGLIENMNPVAEKLCGWLLADALGKPLDEVFKIINAETRETVTDPVKKVLEKGEIVGLANHTILLSQNGTEYQIADSAAPIKNKEGAIAGVILVFSDISGTYTAQRLIKESEERYRSLMHNLEAGIVVHAPDTTIVMNNDRASELLGLSHEQMRGKAAIDPAWKFIHEDNTPLTLDEYPVNRISTSKQAIKDQILGVVQPNKSDVVWLTVNGFPVLDTKGAIKEIVISFIDISERKQGEEALAVQRQLYEQILEQSLAGYWDWDIPTGEEYLSPTFKKMFGYEDNEIENRAESWQKLIFAEDLPGVYDKYKQHTESKGKIPFYNEVRYHHKNGATVWVICTGKVIEWDKDGNAKRMIGCHIDITERKQAEETLALLSARQEAILDAVPDILMEVDNNKIYTWANQAGIDFFGEDVIGKEAKLFFVGEQDIYKTVQPLFYGSKDILYVESWQLRKDGAHRLLAWNCRSLRDAQGNICGALSSGHDITERKQAEEKLKESELKYRLLIENTTDVVFCVDEKGEYKFTNQVFAKTFGKTPDYFVGKTFWDIYSKEEADYRYEAVKEMFRTGEVQTIEVAVPLPDRTLYFLAKANPIKDETGKVILNLTTATDITERKQSEEALKLAELKFRTFADYTYDWEYWEDENNKMIYISPSSQHITGYTSEEFISDPQLLNSIIYPDDLDAVHKHHEKTYSIQNRNEQDELEFRIIKKDGSISTIHHTCRPIYNEDEKFLGRRVSNRDITERKQAEKILEEIISKNPMSIQIVDKNGYTLSVNSSHTRLFGSVPPPEFTIFNDTQLEMQGFKEMFERVKKGEIVHFPDTYFNAHDFNPELPDTPVWVRGVIFPLMDSSGNPERFVLMQNDITERKQAEDKLITSENKFRQIAENIKEVFWISEPDWSKIYYISPTYYDVWGLEAEKLYEQPFLWMDSIIEEDIEKVRSSIPEAITKDIKEIIFPDYRIKKSDGTIIWISARAFPIFDSEGNPHRIAGIAEDITERKQAEEALKESEEKFSNAFHTSPYAITITRPKDGAFIDINDAFTTITGYTREEAFADSSVGLKLWADINDRNRVILDLQEGRKVAGKEYLFCKKTGESITGMFSAQIIHLNNVPYILSSINDITARKQVENELITAKLQAEESDRLKSAFLANMSHEIRTPMNGILGFAELLKEPDLTGEKQQEYIAIIGKSGKRMLNIINDIVDISKIEAGLMKLDIKESNINEQIEYIYTFFKPEVEAKGMKLSFHTPLPAKEAIITTDREKLYAILTNLVKNAIKYSKEGTIEIGYLKKGESLEYYVKDTGIGIPKDRQEAIFERFIQADIVDKMAYQGAGLGLAISKAYIEMLGGKIWVESQESIGSAFYFTLPYNAEPVIETINLQFAPSVKIDTIRKLKILIAEDDDVSEMLIDITVKMFSKEIIKATTGVEAVEACRNNPDIDLVLMDIRMPDMGGYEATRQIREFNKDVVIIAQTAYGLTGNKEKASEAGCNDYIAKPIVNVELLALIQKYFGK